MAFLVWQVPPPSVLMEIPRLVLQILSVEMISLHNLQFFFLQGSIILGVSTSRTLFFTRILLNDLGLLYATIGTEVKISLAAVSFWRRWKCFFNADGRRATLGCQSQTKINCGSCFIFSVSSKSLLRVSSKPLWWIFWDRRICILFSQNMMKAWHSYSENRHFGYIYAGPLWIDLSVCWSWRA